jgi:hypothetical protein
VDDFADEIDGNLGTMRRRDAHLDGEGVPACHSLLASRYMRNHRSHMAPTFGVVLTHARAIELDAANKRFRGTLSDREDRPQAFLCCRARDGLAGVIVVQESLWKLDRTARKLHALLIEGRPFPKTLAQDRRPALPLPLEGRPPKRFHPGSADSLRMRGCQDVQRFGQMQRHLGEVGGDAETACRSGARTPLEARGVCQVVMPSTNRLRYREVGGRRQAGFEMIEEIAADAPPQASRHPAH